MPKAIALFSGGLDSTLAILALLKQGVDVTAITFLNNFGCNIVTEIGKIGTHPIIQSQ